jgi:hypothetical protein
LVDSLPVRIAPRWKDEHYAEGFPAGVPSLLADIEDGVRPGVSTTESAELRSGLGRSPAA